MKIIYKPWGKEEWLELNDKYCYKRIYINAGYKTSYQYHNFKRETNYIISGEAEIWLENEEGVVEKKIMKSGDFFNVLPPKKHRVIALTDIILQEVSTPEVDDVIRIEDDTNRENGKIENEHKTPAVLILCAGLGTRLKNLTKHINKVLLPINNKSILSHIINKFPNNYDFIIALGYHSDSIKEYCKTVYPNHKFQFVEIDNFVDYFTGPGYSALQCSHLLQRPFYFTTGDCIIDSELPHLDGNWVGVHQTAYPEKYSTVSVDENDNIISFINKNSNGFDLAFIGLGAILDYEIFWKELSKNDDKSEIITAFHTPSSYKNLKIKKLKWFDTGNLDDLEKTKQYYKDKPLSLKKETEEITYLDNGKFLKFSPNKILLENRNKRLIHLKNLIPDNCFSLNNFLVYDWVEGYTLYEYDSHDLFFKFLDFLKINLKNISPTNKKLIEKFYVEKSLSRLNLFISKYGDKYYENNFEINGKKYKSLFDIFQKLPFNLLYENPFYNLFHGDLQFDNILYNSENDKFYYIDWRESFAGNTEMGDVYYDLSKLYGGILIPYNLMKDDSKINYEEGSYYVQYDYPVSKNLFKFKSTYETWLLTNGYDLNIVKLITGLIFLNMSPLHEGKFGKMLWFKSIEMLNEYDK